jgi:hypothetical protein
MAEFGIRHSMLFSDDFIKAFNSKEYEKFVLQIMNKSKKVFPNKYSYVENQSHGECDFIDDITGEKFDAKLPFETEQISMLTNGKAHAPMIEEWIHDLSNEACEYSLVDIRKGTFQISETRLYKTIKKYIQKNKSDENIILFFPFPIVLSCRGTIFSEFATDYLMAIYNGLSSETGLLNRKIYAIYPSAEKSVFAVRDLSKYIIEYIHCTSFDKYFVYEVTGVYSEK